jgi:cysteine desulfurase / selenocysteine lyase
MAGTVYLDYAATSAIRPPEVADAMSAYLRDVGATPGRAAHRRSLDAGRVVFGCRRLLAELFALPGDAGRLAFQPNATQALNTALFGTLRPGDRVVRTAYDHNAVRRPVAALRTRGVEEVVLAGSAAGGIDLDEAARALSGGSTDGGRGAGNPARLLVLPHVSNVLGNVLPVAALAERAHAAGALVLLDAAQSAGHLPLSVERLGVDLLAITGHKGLLGPQGTGALWVREGVEVAPLLYGGTGGDSWALDMPDAYPDRLEAGTQNGPGIAGLRAGVEWVMREGVDAIHARLTRLKHRLRDRLARVPGLAVLSPAAPEGAAIVLVDAAGIPSAALAHRLDVEHGVLTRAGLHCAPEVHSLLGTEATGAVRFSLGWATTERDVDRAAEAVRTVCGNAVPPAEVHPSRS